MLSGKNKDNFERWLTLDSGVKGYVGENKYVKTPDGFYSLPLELQKGVYEKYFDSLGYKILIDWAKDGINWMFVIEIKEFADGCGGYKTRLEAFTEAVKQLDKLINDEL